MAPSLRSPRLLVLIQAALSYLASSRPHHRGPPPKPPSPFGDTGPPKNCPQRFMAPGAPLHATDWNGVAIPDVCFMNASDAHHVFVIGDWGGEIYSKATGLVDFTQKDVGPTPADHTGSGPRSKGVFEAYKRAYIWGADDVAQVNVARQMALRAAKNHQPDYVLNVGDNFYWGGIAARCGEPTYQHIETGQWENVFERVYTGPGLDFKQWLGVLGNHDYGGYKFTAAWDAVIGYTWGKAYFGEVSQDRWMTPAQYWKSKVWYPDFSVDYFFLDSNVMNAYTNDQFLNHNICGRNNPEGSSCGAMGPGSVEDCPDWFEKLWAEQILWLEEGLSASKAEWQIIVTHFPPEWGKEGWIQMAAKHGIDLMLSGHRHTQEVWAPHHKDNFLGATAWVVSGGGGGITSQGVPQKDGNDDQYGFVDLQLMKQEIIITAISHGGQIRSTTSVSPRPPGDPRGSSDVPAECAFDHGDMRARANPHLECPAEMSKCVGYLAGEVFGKCEINQKWPWGQWFTTTYTSSTSTTNTVTSLTSTVTTQTGTTEGTETTEWRGEVEEADEALEAAALDSRNALAAGELIGTSGTTTSSGPQGESVVGAVESYLKGIVGGSHAEAPAHAAAYHEPSVESDIHYE